MKHLGDITKIFGYDVPPVDCVIGGSPCQDLSIAGKRAGLSGARSGLFMEQIRIVKEMREADKKRGRTGNMVRPRFLVWENVPGAFSSNKGDDFRAVLEETIRIAEPDAPDVPLPPKGKWPLADCWMGDGWSVAYRVLDAQFWGVPQRRRRIALVADFGGHAAPEILFIRQGVCGDTAAGGAPGKAVTARIEVGAGAAVALRMRAGCEGGGKGALIQVEKSGTLGCNNDQTIFCLSNTQGGAEMRSDDKAPTLTAAAGMSGNNQPVICAGFKPHMGAKARGIDYEEEKVPTIDTGKPMAVFRSGTDYLTGWDNQEKRVFSAKGVSPTLSGGDGGGGRTVCGYIYDARGNGDRKTACTLTGDHQSRVTDYTAIAVQPLPFDTTQITSPQNGCHPHYGDPCHPLATGAHPPAIVMATGQAGAEVTRDMSPTLNCNHEQPIVAHTLRAQGNDPHRADAATYPITNGIVRRLTPTECELLQGYPRGWTEIGPWTDSKGKRHNESSDNARYKALGNSIAIPPWKWVLKRLCAQYERDATMASLFDGISGFCWVWTQLNGMDSVKWVSEIEEFCIAVCKKHFGDDEMGEKGDLSEILLSDISNGLYSSV